MRPATSPLSACTQPTASASRQNFSATSALQDINPYSGVTRYLQFRLRTECAHKRRHVFACELPISTFTILYTFSSHLYRARSQCSKHLPE